MAKGKKRISQPKKVAIAIKTPVALPPAGRGFYQVEEELLYVPVFPSGEFFSYLDSQQLQIDIDRVGRLLFMHVLVPRRQWRVDRNLRAPADAAEADIRFLDFRSKLPEAGLSCNPDRSLLRIRFQSIRKVTSYRPADHLIVDMAPDNTVAAIWVTAIDDDRAARGMAAWRVQVREHFDKQTFDSRLTPFDRER
jgi:hypothetical protein